MARAMTGGVDDNIGRAAPIDVSDVASLLRTWADDGVLVGCQFFFGSFAAQFRARAVSVSATELRLRADDDFSELVLRFRDGVRFGYNDMREPPQPERKYDHLIVIFFPYTGDPADADKVILYEILEDVEST